MTPYQHYLELREQQKQVHIGHRDEYAALGKKIDDVLDQLDEGVDAFFGDG